ncbi:Integrase-like protein [Tenacibaculum sp. 190130A14a]|uniref:tyrosine-type recombinase/integrase n=1 Tax=Tenacibaculum polynesiense TaxID=3137857 RepID=UPI00320364E6
MYFYLKQPKSDKATLIDLIYHLKAEKKNFKYSTGQKIIPTDWDSSARYPKLKRGSSGKKNKQIALILDNYKKHLEETIADFKIQNRHLTREDLKLIFEKKFNANYKDDKIPFNVKDAIEVFIESKKKGGGVSDNWKKKYTNLKNKITLFDVYNKRQTVFSDLNESWLDAYCGFLRDFPNLVDRKKAKEIKSVVPKVGQSDNTLYRHVNLLFTFLKWVRKNYKIEIQELTNPVDEYDTDDIHLTDEEIKKIEKVYLASETLKRARDIFLIGVYSGQRFSDYSVFEKEDIVQTKNGEIIIKRADKTEKESFIPLHNKLKVLLDRFEWNIPQMSTQKFNPYIKEVCMRAKINNIVKKTTHRGNKKEVEYQEKWKMVVSHTARRTFITLSSEKGMPDHIIMKITGIRNTETLAKYKKTSQDSVFDYMNSTWG